MKGRKPKPTALKLLTGNPGKRKLNTREPVADPLGTDCPPELNEADAVEEWQRTIVPAIYRRQITSADRVFAIAHCALWATWRSQLADASRHAHVILGKNGQPLQNPARKTANQTFVLLAKVDAELGLTPASRSRVTVASEPHAQTQDKWSGLLG